MNRKNFLKSSLAGLLGLIFGQKVFAKNNCDKKYGYMAINDCPFGIRHGNVMLKFKNKNPDHGNKIIIACNDRENWFIHETIELVDHFDSEKAKNGIKLRKKILEFAEFEIVIRKD